MFQKHNKLKSVSQIWKSWKTLILLYTHSFAHIHCTVYMHTYTDRPNILKTSNRKNLTGNFNSNNL